MRGRRAGRHMHKKIPVHIASTFPSSPVNTTSQEDLRKLNRTLVPIPKSDLALLNVSTSTVRYDFPSFFLCNAQSLGNKMDEFETILSQNSIDVGVVSETWFNPTKQADNVMQINDYQLFVKSRTVIRGSGVAVYVKSDIQAKQIHDLPVPDKVECVWVLLQPKRLPRSVSTIAVCCVYNSTSSTREDEHELELHILESMDLLQTKYPDVSFVVLGDFNRMNINSILNAQSLKQIVYFPTRGQATLDKVLTNIDKFYEKPYPYCPIGKSDHTCVVWNPRTHQSHKFTNKTRTYRPMKDSQIREFGTWIQSQDWCDVLQADSTQLKTDVFYKTVNQAIDMHFPNVTVKCHDKPWINKKIKVLIHSRQQAFSSGNVTVYKKLRNQVKREIEKCKVNYYADRVRNLQTIEPRKWHQEIRTMTRNVKSDLCIPVPYMVLECKQAGTFQRGNIKW